MATKKQKTDIDEYLSFIFISRLLAPIDKTKAFKSGLVDKDGKVIREPEEGEETDLTLLDKTIFYLKRVMAGKLMRLRDFMFIHMNDEDFTDKLALRGSIKDRAQIKKVKRKIDQHLKEELDCDFNEFIGEMVLQEVRSASIKNRAIKNIVSERLL